MSSNTTPTAHAGTQANRTKARLPQKIQTPIQIPIISYDRMGRTEIIDANGDLIARCWIDGDAEQIVEAVNSRAALTAEVAELRERIKSAEYYLSEYDTPDTKYRDNCIAAARTALAKGGRAVSTENPFPAGSHEARIVDRSGRNSFRWQQRALKAEKQTEILRKGIEDLIGYMKLVELTEKDISLSAGKRIAEKALSKVGSL